MAIERTDLFEYGWNGAELVHKAEGLYRSKANYYTARRVFSASLKYVPASEFAVIDVIQDRIHMCSEHIESMHLEARINFLVEDFEDAFNNKNLDAARDAVDDLKVFGYDDIISIERKYRQLRNEQN